MSLLLGFRYALAAGTVLLVGLGGCAGTTQVRIYEPSPSHMERVLHASVERQQGNHREQAVMANLSAGDAVGVSLFQPRAIALASQRRQAEVIAVVDEPGH